MNMINVHSKALEQKIASYHEFLNRYSTKKKVVYGFVEGKDDPCYYHGFIESKLPEGWDIELWAAGSKEQVFRIHSDIDWRRFPKKRVCFFVDRDLSCILGSRNRSDKNIYITDGYSIENSIVNRKVCCRVLNEVCSLGNVQHKDIEGVCDVFQKELEKFYKLMIPIMSWISAWKANGKRPNLNNIKMSQLFFMKECHLKKRKISKWEEYFVGYIHKQCNVKYDPKMEISLFEEKFRKDNIYRNFVRGKFVLWFLISFCLSVRESASKLFRSVVLQKMNVTLCESNGMAIIGNRARIPNSLLSFIENTYISYISKSNSKKIL